MNCLVQNERCTARITHFFHLQVQEILTCENQMERVFNIVFTNLQHDAYVYRSIFVYCDNAISHVYVLPLAMTFSLNFVCVFFFHKVKLYQ
jgi:hypothetical protein